MDIQRTQNPRLRKLKQYRYPVGGLVLLVCLSAVIGAYSPSVPSVAISELWIGEVEQGAFTREVRGPGSLVSNQIRWLTARSSGRVEQIHRLAGSEVSAETLLLELSNPDLQQAARTARLDYIAAEAEHKALLAELAEDLLAQEVRLLEARTNLEQAEFRYAAELKLAEDNIIAGVDLNESRLAVQQNAARLALEQKRSRTMPDLHRARREAGEARLAQYQEAWQLQQEAVAALKVYAGINGVLQQLPLEQGQQVTQGALLARVADPRDLRAELRIPEVQAKDVELGLTVNVDTRNGTVKGTVSRIDPAVENGTVAVDVNFTGGLPDSTRIDQSVDGAIELEAFQNTLFVQRPSQMGATGRAQLFRVSADGRSAQRVPVRTGGSSVLHLQILEGLEAGDRIILSDMSRFQDQDQLVLE